MAQDDYELGPKMRVLTDKQRAFVMALAEFPGMSHAEAARKAGYSDVAEGAKVRACNLMQDKKIIDALQEQAGKKLWALSMKAAWRAEQLLDSQDETIVAKAIGMILDRAGHAPQQNINVHQHVTDDSGKALIERIGQLAQRLNVPVSGLLKQQPAPVVEGEFTEVQKDE